MSSTKDQIGERIGRARAVSIRLVDFEMAEILIQYIACVHESFGCGRNFISALINFKMVDILIQFHESFGLRARFEFASTSC
jgi:hypothetical protein